MHPADQGEGDATPSSRMEPQVVGTARCSWRAGAARAPIIRGEGAPRGEVAAGRAVSRLAPLRLGRGHRGAHDPGVVEQLRRDDGGAHGQPRDEPLRSLRDAAADDEQLGAEQLLDREQVLVEVHRPGLPREATLETRRGRRPALRVAAADLHVPELEVGHQHAVVEQRGPGAGPEGDQEHRSRCPTPAPKRISATPAASASFTRWTGRRRTVRARVGVEVDPARVHVRRALRDPSMTTAGKPTPTGTFASMRLRLDLLDHPGDRGDDRGGRGRWRGRHAVARAESARRCPGRPPPP